MIDLFAQASLHDHAMATVNVALTGLAIMLWRYIRGVRRAGE